MQSQIRGKNIILILSPEEELTNCIIKICEKYNLINGLILSGIGQLKNVKLGYFKRKNEYSPTNYEKPLEILSLNGNICKEGDEYITHIHAILGDENKNAIGGHFFNGTVTVTAEIIIQKTEFDVKRIQDEKTGLKMLKLK